jgi:hypothetical protein
MSIEPEVEEIVSRSVAIVVCYYHFAKTWEDWAAILAKIQALSGDIEDREVSIRSIVPLLRIELNDRFDRETAHRLFSEFSDMLALVCSSRGALTGHR